MKVFEILILLIMFLLVLLMVFIIIRDEIEGTNRFYKSRHSKGNKRDTDEDKGDDDRKMSIIREIVEYDREDMLKLDNMSYEEIRQAIDDLDRGYFNKSLFPEYDNENTVYSEEDYNIYRMTVALRKVDSILRNLDNNEKKVKLGKSY